MKDFNKIVVKLPNWVGDVVMATPVLEELREHFPKAQIMAMCQANLKDLLQGNPFIDGVLAYQKPMGAEKGKQVDVLVSELKKGQFDLGVLLTNSFSSAWWLWRGGVKFRVGFGANLRSFLLSQAPSFPARRNQQHLVETYKELLKCLGIEPKDSRPRLFLKAEELTLGKAFLEKLGVLPGRRLLGINPGAAFGSAKCWPKSYFRELTTLLLNDMELSILYFGDKSGKELVEEICQGFPADQVFNLANKTSLRELIALIELCDVFLSNDSGPMHIAAALQKPVVALFGPTDAVISRPYPKGTVLQKPVSCSPCHLRACPKNSECMLELRPKEVFEALKVLLNQEMPRVWG